MKTGLFISNKLQITIPILCFQQQGLRVLDPLSHHACAHHNHIPLKFEETHMSSSQVNPRLASPPYDIDVKTTDSIDKKFRM